MSTIGDQCLRLRLLFSISRFRGLVTYSTAVAATAKCESQTHFMVDYLTDSLGFSREEAISLSKKVTHFKSTKQPNSVINFFTENGLDKTQIRSIVSSLPTSLSYKVDGNLKPKFKFLQGLGLRGWDLVKVILGNPVIFYRRLDTHIIPSINHLKEILGGEEDVVKAIRKPNWLLSHNVVQRMPLNLLLLKECGLSNEKIKKFISYYPTYFIQKPEWLEEVVHRVEVVGNSRESPIFFHGLCAAASNSKSTLEMKFGIFRSFLWTDSDINTMARKLP